MRGKHAEAIPEVVHPVRLCHSGTCQNLVKPLLQKICSMAMFYGME